MVPERPDIEQRLANLQLRVEQLRQHADGSGPGVERRLADIADQYTEHLKRWASTVDRHSKAVTRLESYIEEWKEASLLVRQHTTDRLQEFDATIEREWQTLKERQEAPLRALQASVESLTHASTAIVSTSQHDVGRAAERFAAFEAEVRLRLEDMTREFSTAVSEMKGRLERPPAREGSPEWSLSDVTRLHEQLRGGPQRTPALPAVATTAVDIPAPPEPVPLETEPRPAIGQDADRLGSRRAKVAAVLAVAAVGAGVFAWRLQSRIEQLNERALVAQQKAEQAIRDAAEQSEAMRKQAAVDAVAHRDMAARATRVADVVAAPDLVRIPLSGTNGASGHALFSRSRGLVVSGGGIPSPSSDRVLQAWLLTRAAPVKVGPLVAEPDGTFLLAQELTEPLPVPVVGVIVTSDPVGGESGPPGTPVLTSVQP